MSDFMLDVGLANELKLAFRRSGYSTQEIKQLCEGDALVQFRRVLLGCAVITALDHVIDLNAEPFVPDGWVIEEHQKASPFKWASNEVALYLSEVQKREERTKGNVIRNELVDKSPYNANLLDYLLAHPELIPNEWKDNSIFFFGTIYRYSNDHLLVRCLSWRNDEWCSGEDSLDSAWFGNQLVAIRAS